MGPFHTELQCLPHRAIQGDIAGNVIEKEKPFDGRFAQRVVQVPYMVCEDIHVVGKVASNREVDYSIPKIHDSAHEVISMHQKQLIRIVLQTGRARGDAGSEYPEEEPEEGLEVVLKVVNDRRFNSCTLNLSAGVGISQ